MQTFYLQYKRGCWWQLLAHLLGMAHHCSRVSFIVHSGQGSWGFWRAGYGCTPSRNGPKTANLGCVWPGYDLVLHAGSKVPVVGDWRDFRWVWTCCCLCWWGYGSNGGSGFECGPGFVWGVVDSHWQGPYWFASFCPFLCYFCYSLHFVAAKIVLESI